MWIWIWMYGGRSCGDWTQGFPHAMYIPNSFLKFCFQKRSCQIAQVDLKLCNPNSAFQVAESTGVYHHAQVLFYSLFFDSIYLPSLCNTNSQKMSTPPQMGASTLHLVNVAVWFQWTLVSFYGPRYTKSQLPIYCGVVCVINFCVYSLNSELSLKSAHILHFQLNCCGFCFWC